VPKVRLDEGCKTPWIVEAIKGGIALSDKEKQRFLEACFQEFVVTTKGVNALSEKQLNTLIEGLLGEWLYHSQNIAAARREALSNELEQSVRISDGGFDQNAFMRVLRHIEETMRDDEFSNLISGRHFVCSGDAALLVRALDPSLKIDIPGHRTPEAQWR
jgi:hypothetical protein